MHALWDNLQVGASNIMPDPERAIAAELAEFVAQHTDCKGAP